MRQIIIIAAHQILLIDNKVIKPFYFFLKFMYVLSAGESKGRDEGEE